MGPLLLVLALLPPAAQSEQPPSPESVPPFDIDLHSDFRVGDHLLITVTSGNLELEPGTLGDGVGLFILEPPEGARIRPELAWTPSGYETSVDLTERGTWRLVTFPDIVDRAEIPAGYPDVLEFRVRSWWVEFTMLGALIAAGLAVVFLPRRRRVRRAGDPTPEREPPVQADTWWWG